MRWLVAAVLAVVAAPALAYDEHWTRYDEADANLSAAYHAVLAHAQGQSRISVRNSERAWIAQRNRNCGFETKGVCALRMTVQRTSYLLESLPDPSTYRPMSSSRLVATETALNNACREPGQDADGPICGRQEAALIELQRRGLR